jgi:glycosyltransferase involved in cell wall biosynthesis
VYTCERLSELYGEVTLVILNCRAIQNIGVDSVICIPSDSFFVQVFQFCRAISGLIRKGAQPHAFIGFSEQANTLLAVSRRLGGISGPILMRLSTVVSDYLRGRPVRRVVAIATYLAANVIIAQSKTIKRDFESEFGVNWKKVVQIGNEFIGWRATPDLLDQSIVGRPFILCLGNFRPEKGHLRLIRIFASTSSEISLVLVGSGELVSEINNAIKSFSLSGRVVMTGVLDNPVNYIAASAGIFIPSHFEGNPNVVYEADHYGKPIGGFSDCAVLHELQGDGYDITLIEPDNSQAFSSLLDRWSSSCSPSTESPPTSSRSNIATLYTAAIGHARSTFDHI